MKRIKHRTKRRRAQQYGKVRTARRLLLRVMRDMWGRFDAMWVPDVPE